MEFSVLSFYYLVRIKINLQFKFKVVYQLNIQVNF